MVLHSAQKRACFICGSVTGTALQQHLLPVLGLDEVEYAVRCCAGCGLVLQDPVVAPSVMARHYALFSNYLEQGAGVPAGDQGPVLNQAALRLVGQMERLGLAPGAVFDVGAATGRLLWHLRRRGWRVSGCEPSAAAVAQARALYGIDLITAFEDDALPSMHGLDCVLFSHVLEHVYDPAATLRRVAAALKPDGWVLFEVPTLEAAMGPGIFMMEHLTYFTPVSAANLLRSCGFEPVLTERSDMGAYPVITVAARRAPEASAVAIEYDADGAAAASAYVRCDAELWRRSDARLAECVARGRQIAIWGAGLHTSMLLARTGLAFHADIVEITDRDTQKHGRRLGRYGVVPPATVIAGDLPIVISSFHSEGIIAAELAAHGVAEDRIVRLYG